MRGGGRAPLCVEQASRRNPRPPALPLAGLVAPHPPVALCGAVAAAGSGGAEFGRRVAEELHYGFFGSEIVDQIAAEREIAPQLLDGLDEHVRHAIERFVTDAFQERATLGIELAAASVVRVLRERFALRPR